MNEGKFRIGSGSRSGRTAAYTRYRLSGAAKMVNIRSTGGEEDSVARRVGGGSRA